jgi:hypothetical protein
MKDANKKSGSCSYVSILKQKFKPEPVLPKHNQIE